MTFSELPTGASFVIPGYTGFIYYKQDDKVAIRVNQTATRIASDSTVTTIGSSQELIFLACDILGISLGDVQKIKNQSKNKPPIDGVQVTIMESNKCWRVICPNKKMDIEVDRVPDPNCPNDCSVESNNMRKVIHASYKNGTDITNGVINIKICRITPWAYDKLFNEEA